MPIEESKIKQINTRSEYFQDILDKVPSRIVSWGTTGLIIIFVIVCLGLRFVKYPEVVTSEALVTTDTPPIEVFSRSSGRVSYFLQKDQSPVKAGDWVIVLNNSANYKDVLKLIQSLKTVDSGDIVASVQHVVFDEGLDLGEIQNSYSQFIKATNEIKLFLSLNASNRQLDINFKRQAALDSVMNRLQKQLVIVQRQTSLADTDYERNVELQKESVIARSELEQKEITFLSQKSKVEDLKTTMLNSQLQIEALHKENATLKTDRGNDYFTLRSNILQAYNSLIFELASWQIKYVIEAPINGLLNLYETRTKDQFLANEAKVFTVTAQGEQNYFAIIKLPVANSGRIHTGQICIIKLNNFPYTEFGMLKGKVSLISAAAKEGYYNVRVDLPDQLRTTMNKQLQSKSELTGEADLIIKDYTLFERLFNYFNSKNY